MIANSQDTGDQEGWDVTQLLSIVNSPLEPKQTLDTLKDFTSSKNYVEIARRLSQEDATKLVDVFDQVCRASLLDVLAHLTTTMMTRLSDPSIGGRLRIRRC